MEILYLSNLASAQIVSEVQTKKPDGASFAVQKFNRLIVQGFAKNNIRVRVLSSFYNSGSLMWYHRKETVEGVAYHYISSINLLFIRHVWLAFYCFFYVLLWGTMKRKEKALVCDVLNVSACTGAVMAASLLGLKRVGIMTDMPGLMVDQSSVKQPKKHILGISSANRNKRYLEKFTHYVFLTEQMNEVNTFHRPYIVMEGLVTTETSNIYQQKDHPRVVFYAGGLHERYGLKMLVEAVKLLPQQDIQLVLYGDGPYVKDLIDEKDTRIQYRGMAPNDVIVEQEQRATLLVNPRPTHEDFTKYSFPSKNMEYMLSGTPLLTTRLPGMPSEYYPYVYLFDEETTEGFALKLNEILSLPSAELREKGDNARRFVLTKKTNIVQTARIIKLINE